MSDELNKEMEQVDEESVEEAVAPKATSPSSVKLKQEPVDMQKSQGGPKASAPKATKGAVKPVSTVEETEEVEEEVEEIQEMPKLKSEILAGIVDHMKGLKKEDLANLYGKTVLGEEDEEEEDEEEEEEEEETKIKKESIDQVVDSLDVSDDVNALVEGEELSEEFKTKAATIFESAVKSKVRVELEKIQEQNDKVMEDLAESTMGDLVEKVDDYMNYVVEQWMEDNQLAIERGLKGEIAEDFISGLKNLFEDHYIDVPDEKYDILESNLTKIEELEEKLNKQIEENVQLRKAKGELVKESMIADIANGMTDTETEKFQSLVEDVEFSDEESYKEKLQTIRESYFGTNDVKTTEVLTEEGSNEMPVETSDTMAQYLSAIGKDAKRSK
jgi:hypothetical protein